MAHLMTTKTDPVRMLLATLIDETQSPRPTLEKFVSLMSMRDEPAKRCGDSKATSSTRSSCKVNSKAKFARKQSK